MSSGTSSGDPEGPEANRFGARLSWSESAGYDYYDYAAPEVTPPERSFTERSPAEHSPAEYSPAEYSPAEHSPAEHSPAAYAYQDSLEGQAYPWQTGHWGQVQTGHWGQVKPLGGEDGSSGSPSRQADSSERQRSDDTRQWQQTGPREETGQSSHAGQRRETDLWSAGERWSASAVPVVPAASVEAAPDVVQGFAGQEQESFEVPRVWNDSVPDVHTQAMKSVSAPSKPVRRGKAGRDLPAAIGVGLGLSVLVAGSLYLNGALFVGVTVVAVIFAVWELSQAFNARDIRSPMVPVVAGSVAMLIGAYVGEAQALMVATALTVLGILVWRLPEGVEGYLRDSTAGILAALYVPFLASFAMLMLAEEDGNRRVTAFILVTACSDIGGYVAGVFLGRHPMAPSISPKKSWEGFVGSALACMVGGAVGIPLLVGGDWWQGALIGLFVALTATVGDLIESVIKRDLGVKDMGALLPGHGGLMDRLDSLLVTAPVAWLLLSVLVPAS